MNVIENYKPNEYKISMNQTQRYYIKTPVNISEVKGVHAQIVFLIMTKGKVPDIYKFPGNYPQDVCDIERVEALLICYPEWRSWMPDLKQINKKWSLFGDQWEQITNLYHTDIYECKQVIETIVNHKIEVHDEECPYKNLPDKTLKMCNWCLS